MDGKVQPITKTVIRLKTLRNSLPTDTISDYSAKQRLLDAMDIRLRREVKPLIKPSSTFEEIVEIAENRDAVMHSTGIYRSQKSHHSNAITPVQPRNIQQRQQPPRNNPANPSRIQQTEKDRRRREGLCLYCGKKGHYADRCFAKQNQNNQNRNHKPGNYSKQRRNPFSFHTQMQKTVQTNVTSNHVGPSATQPLTLEAYITVNGHQAKALFDTGTMGDNLISGKFVSTHHIPTSTLDNPIALKMAVKGSRSTINYRAQPVIQIGPESGEITETLVCSLENYDIFLGMPYLHKHKAIIDCGNA